MYTENGKEIIDDNTIVEFKYDGTKQFDLIGFLLEFVMIKQGNTKKVFLIMVMHIMLLKVYGGLFRIPSQPEMITTGKNIPVDTTNLEVYYNRKGTKSNTRGLRDFQICLSNVINQ